MAPPTLDEKKRRLSVVGASLDKVTKRREDLFDERLALLKDLHDEGVEQAELARLARMTKNNVKFALFKDRRRTADAANGTG